MKAIFWSHLKVKLGSWSVFLVKVSGWFVENLCYGLSGLFLRIFDAAAVQGAAQVCSCTNNVRLSD